MIHSIAAIAVPAETACENQGGVNHTASPSTAGVAIEPQWTIKVPLRGRRHTVDG